MKSAFFALVMFVSFLANAKTVCSWDQQAELLIENIQSHESIDCEANKAQKILICHPPSGHVVLDLIQEKSTLRAEGYWSSTQATVWVSIQLQTKMQFQNCIVTNYSFDAAVED